MYRPEIKIEAGRDLALRVLPLIARPSASASVQTILLPSGTVVIAVYTGPLSVAQILLVSITSKIFPSADHFFIGHSASVVFGTVDTDDVVVPVGRKEQSSQPIHFITPINFDRIKSNVYNTIIKVI